MPTVPKKYIQLLYEQGITYKPYKPSKEEGSLNRKYLKSYGITYDDYYKILKDQKGACAICFKLADSKKRLAVDHCHATNKIRGLLCHSCNLALGLFKDNQESLKKALDYLKNSEIVKYEEKQL